MTKNAVYINLDRRTDRKALIEAELSKFGFKFRRQPGITKPNGPVGCSRAHIEALKMGLQFGSKHFFVFEDDFEFLVSRKALDAMLCSVRALHGYDLVMLSYNLIKGMPHNEVFGRVLDAQTTSGILVASEFAPKLIACLEEGLAEFNTGEARYKDYIVDQYWKKLQPHSRWFFCLTRVGRQRPGLSDLCGCFMDHGC